MQNFNSKSSVDASSESTKQRWWTIVESSKIIFVADLMFFIVRYKLGYYKVIQQNSEGYKQIGR